MKKDKKKGVKKAGVIVWGSVTTFFVVLLIVVSVLTMSTFYDIICIVLGGPKADYSLRKDASYIADYESKDDVLKAANDLNTEVCEEGIVLLKNENNALPLRTPESKQDKASQKPRVSVFGKNSVDLVYGGSGSGGSDSSKAKTIYDSLKKAGYETNPELQKFYKNSSRSGAKRKQSGDDLDSGDTVVLSTGETPQSKYDSAVKKSYASYNDAAIVVFSRVGGEGFDLPRSMKGATGARQATDHYLQLDQNETDLLAAVCNGDFKKVIVVLNTGSQMELGFLTDPAYYAYQEKIDAALWMGFPGGSGVMALGSVLNGNVNPSGRTVDTYAADLKKDPTWNNFGDNLITGNMNKKVQGGDQYNLGNALQLFYFVDYEEGVYVGYKYYETRGVTDGEDWYKKNVVYPFGYGLSYTDFTWTIEDKSSIENVTISKDGKYTVSVRVTNNGSVAGKDVVQLYGHAPYTTGGIEKPEEVLLDFAKTPLIQPGDSKVVTLTFDPYYLASYDYKDRNGNLYKGYELDAGDNYALYVSKNAHDKAFTIPFKSGNIRYEYSTVNPDVKVENLYTDQEQYFNSDEQLSTVLSRADWEGTWPTAPTAEERSVDSDFIKALKDTTHNNPHVDEYYEMEMPWFDVDHGLTFRSVLEKDENGKYFADYDNPIWYDLLEQCSVEDLIKLCDAGGFQTARIDSIKKAPTNDTDGPAGFTNFMSQDGTYYGTCHYCSETVMSSTWNVELIEELGKMVGNEGLIGATEGEGNGLPYTGWYAPGVNIHRSAFGGRNFEYFSEDGVLNGKMAAAEIKGCQSKGVYCYVKHFALNEQETHRSIGGDCSWVTEQAMREIFLRPFELAVKEGGTRAMMSSFNRIGTRWTGGDYRLLTQILREEWGFKGMVITDFNTIDYMNTRQMAYAGGDLNLIALTGTKLWADEGDTADMIVLTRNAKNILYTVANSNYMNGDVNGYTMPWWQILIIVLDCVIPVGMAVWGFFAIRKYIKRRKAFKAAAATQGVDGGENVSGVEINESVQTDGAEVIDIDADGLQPETAPADGAEQGGEQLEVTQTDDGEEKGDGIN
ncbi:MAG: glycoside hydrolase family 3 C-terminal domain-containing protein [Clostridiales bacterium]|nr:glycoside hydrolase family 3 C-terminal domain-containing protein [Clostridiales bacterium]